MRRDEVTGTLIETLVASYLHRVTIALRMPYSINYDPKKEGVDFVLKNIATGETIPIEVTSSVKGKDVKGKDIKKVSKAMNNLNSEYGVVIALKGDLEIRDDICILPLHLFAFL